MDNSSREAISRRLAQQVEALEVEETQASFGLSEEEQKRQLSLIKKLDYLAVRMEELEGEITRSVSAAHQRGLREEFARVARQEEEWSLELQQLEERAVGGPDDFEVVQGIEEALPAYGGQEKESASGRAQVPSASVARQSSSAASQASKAAFRGDSFGPTF